MKFSLHLTPDERRALELLPGKSTEWALRVLLADALGNFRSSRCDPEAYVAKGYRFLNPAEQAEKVEEVEARVRIARFIQDNLCIVELELHDAQEE
jgi:hypothetical protein